MTCYENNDHTPVDDRRAAPTANKPGYACDGDDEYSQFQHWKFIIREMNTKGSSVADAAE